jgi:hypothetical protein
MRRRAGLPPLAAGVGQFAGNYDPQNPTGAVVTDLVDGLSGDPGLRLAHSRGKRTFRGGGLALQVFDGAAQGSVNSPESLENLPIKGSSRLRALGQNPSLVPMEG